MKEPYEPPAVIDERDAMEDTKKLVSDFGLASVFHALIDLVEDQSHGQKYMNLLRNRLEVAVMEYEKRFER